MLILQKEDHKISFWGKVKLFIHLRMCDLCNAFEKQSRFININIPHIHHHHEVKATKEFKQKVVHSVNHSGN